MAFSALESIFLKQEECSSSSGSGAARVSRRPDFSTQSTRCGHSFESR
jgi:hypothetical protein